jgi:hypothetical protein
LFLLICYYCHLQKAPSATALHLIVRRAASAHRVITPERTDRNAAVHAGDALRIAFCKRAH